MRLSSTLEKKTFFSNIYLKVQVIYMKIQVLSSSEPPLDYNQDQLPVGIKVSYDHLNHLEGCRNILQIQISSSRARR